VTRRDPLQRQSFVIEVMRRACVRRGVDYDQVFGNGADVSRLSRKAVLDNNIAAHFIKSSIELRHARRRWDALRVGLRCIRLQPLDLHYYKALIYATISPNIVKFGRRALLRSKL